MKRLQTTQEFTKASQCEHLATLTAPIAGTAQQLTMHTEGGVLIEAQALMVIAPDSASVSAKVTVVLETHVTAEFKTGQRSY